MVQLILAGSLKTLCKVFVLFNTIHRMDSLRNYIKNTRTSGRTDERTEGQREGQTKL